MPWRRRNEHALNWPKRNALRLQRLVDALLDFSRVEAGRVQAVYRQTDLAAFTADIASGFRSACEKAGLSLTIRAVASVRSGLRRPRDVGGKNRPEPRVQRLQVHARRRHRHFAGERGRPCRAARERHRGRHPRGRVAAACSNASIVSRAQGDAPTRARTSALASLWCGNWSTSTRARSRSTAVWDKGRLFPFDWHSARVICRGTGLRPKAARHRPPYAPTRSSPRLCAGCRTGSSRWGSRQGGSRQRGFRQRGFRQRGFRQRGFRQGGSRQGDHARGHAEQGNLRAAGGAGQWRESVHPRRR